MLLTAKEAIKARCRDCNGTNRLACNFDSCELKGLSVAKKGAHRSKAIKLYCKWCLNGNPFTVCTSTKCSIYQYRNKLEQESKE